jgi:hypothetical protein
MNSEQLHQQRVMQAAALRQAERDYAKKRITLDRLNEIRSFKIGVDTFQLPTTTKVATPKATEQSWKPDVPLNQAQEDTLSRLISEQNEIDRQKRQLSNRLKLVPKEQNAKPICDEILKLRNEWMCKGDDIRFFRQNGFLPDADGEGFDVTAFSKDLPKSKYELDQKIRYRRADLSRYKKRLQESKTEVQKVRQEKNIALAEAELRVMEMSFNLIK